MSRVRLPAKNPRKLSKPAMSERASPETVLPRVKISQPEIPTAPPKIPFAKWLFG